MKPMCITLMLAMFSMPILFATTCGRLVAEDSLPNADGFQQDVAPLLSKYCIDCHGPDDPDGMLSLDSISRDLTGDDFETWRLIDERIRFGEMPPKDELKPKPDERQTILNWIRRESLRTQMPRTLSDEKLLLPQFGNYVDHQVLFEQRRSHVTPAAPRIWRLHDVYGNVAEWCVDNALRGGSWISSPDHCRSAYRDSFSSRSERKFIGFRIVIQKIPSKPEQK